MDGNGNHDGGGGAAMSRPPESRRSARSALNGLDVRAWMRFTRSWFLYNPPPRKRDQLCHPAKFPEGVAREFIRFFTAPGESVLDPFAGTGSTLAAAAELERRGVGVELSPEFHALAARRTDLGAGSRVLLGDARRASDLLPEAGIRSVEYVFTSPPYWNMLRKGRGNVSSTHRKRLDAGLRTEYSELPADLGNLEEYEAFLRELADILLALRGVLAPKRYLTVVVQNVRVPGGEVKPLAWDLTRLLAAGFTFKGEQIWVQDNKPLGCWGWPAEFVTNVHHHYCLTFKNDRDTPGTP